MADTTLTQRIEHAIADKGLGIGDAWNLLGEALEYIERLEQRVPSDEDVLSRLRKLEDAVNKGRQYGFQQDIWKAAADEIERLRARPDRADVDQRWAAGTDAREVWRLLQEYRRRSANAAGSREQSDVDGWLLEQLRPMMKEPASSKTRGSLCMYACGTCGKRITTGCYCSEECANADD